MAENPSPSSFDWDDIKSGFEAATRGRKSALPPGIQTRKSWFTPWLAVPVLLALMTVGRSFIVVGAGERAVVFNRFSGLMPGQLGEGLHLLMPFVQEATRYNVKTQNYTMSNSTSEANTSAGNANDALQALTSDGLPVTLELSVQYHVDPEHVDRLHEMVGPDYLENILRPQTRADVRMVVAQYPVVDVYGARRARIIDEINIRLRALLAKNDIILESALLRDVSFSPQFQKAIEQKQVAQQEVQRMAFVVEQADKERRRKIIEAEGEAESIRLKARALAKNPQLTQYDYVQRLPDNVKTIVTDGRTIVNLGDALTPSEIAATTPEPRPHSAPPSPPNANDSSLGGAQ